jgi:hypothetical protein
VKAPAQYIAGAELKLHIDFLPRFAPWEQKYVALLSLGSDEFDDFDLRTTVDGIGCELPGSVLCEVIV